MIEDASYNKVNSDEIDRCSEVFLDIEKGDIASLDSDIGKNINSIANVYENDTVHFSNRLAMELENIKLEQSTKQPRVASKKYNNEDQYYSNSPLTMSLCSLTSQA